MPELPEVEHLRRTLEPHLLGASIERAELRRRDVLDSSAFERRVGAAEALLVGVRVVALHRRGKQLAIVGHDGRTLCVHLGMSGQVAVETDAKVVPSTHQHARWWLRREGGSPARMVFRDPRRFGGLWALPNLDALDTRWNALGPDALGVTADHLRAIAERTRRAVKAALLDQSQLAGVGNIYADEALFRAGIHPRRPFHRLRDPDLLRLAEAIRSVLQAAVDSGGSSLRDYRDAAGAPGAFQHLHLVYGRAGEPCPTCGTALRSGQVGGRTTVWCPRCQPRGLIHRAADNTRPADPRVIHKSPRSR